MKKIIFVFLIIFIIIAGVVVGYMITTNNNKISMENETNKVAVLGAVEDECTEEYEDDDEILASSTEEKVSPNAKFIIEKFHSKCENTTMEEMPVPYDIVNLTKEEVEAKYVGWIAKRFSGEEVVLYGVFNTRCPEHYVLKEVDNQIAIFTENDDGNLTFYKDTQIDTQYLPEEDLIPLRKGIKIHGQIALNEMLENFE